jgi:hypothetical protein
MLWKGVGPIIGWGRRPRILWASGGQKFLANLEQVLARVD